MPIINIVNSYIRERSFSVKMSSALSPTYTVVAGLPQGSCLSPTLYNIFTSDIPHNNSTHLALFADDTAIYCSGIYPRFIITKLEESLQELSDYFSSWKIKINNAKTQAIFCSNRRASRFLPDRNIQFVNTELTWSNDIKYLGVLIDKKLTFEKHCQFANERAQTYIKILYPLINRNSKLSKKNKLLIFKCIFAPIILYAGPVWGKSANSNKKCLQTTQNKILKLALSLPYYHNTNLLHFQANVNFLNRELLNMTDKFIERCLHSQILSISNLYTL